MTQYSNPAFLETLAKKVQQELITAGIKAKVDLFPTKSGPRNGAYSILGNRHIITGSTPQDLQQFYAKSLPCDDNKKNILGTKFLDLGRLMTGIHEAAHAVDYKLGYSIQMHELVSKAETFKGTGKLTDGQAANAFFARYGIMSANIRESFADATAAKYLLTKFGNDPDVAQFIQDRATFREGAKDAHSHQTQAMLREVLADWRANPKINPDYTLTAAAADTASLMDQQRLAIVADNISRGIVFPEKTGKKNNVGDHGTEFILDHNIIGTPPTPAVRKEKKAIAGQRAKEQLCQ